MKKTGILNAALSGIIAAMGHTDRLVVCDVGLPIPRGAVTVDLALVAGVPGFIETLEAISADLEVEQAIVAQELVAGNRSMADQVCSIFELDDVSLVSHERFKELTSQPGNIAFVRTGETTPYANTILVSGVTFG